QELQLMLFAEDTAGHTAHLGVDGPDSAARDLVRSNLLQERHTSTGFPHSIYGYHLGSLEDFFQAVAGDLLTEGRGAFRVQFEADSDAKSITYLKPIALRDLRRVFVGNKRGFYRHVRRSTHPIERSPPVVEYISAEEI